MGSRTEIYLFSILILQALAIPIFAEENIDDSKSVMLETDKQEYQVGERTIISGFVEDDSQALFPEIIVMFTDKEVYQDGDTVTIYGLVSEKDEESVLVGIYDPFGTPAGFYFGNVDSNLEFKVSFLVKAGVNFKTEGTYSISAFYGDSEEVVNFEFVKQNKNQTPIEEKKTSDDIKSSKPNEKITEDKNEFVDTISYYDGMGPALIRLCRYSDAIFYYDQSLLKEPNNIDILTNKGSALAKMGLYEEAIKYYNSALAVNPTNYFTLNNKANALANLGNFQEAFSLYKKALDVGADNLIVLQNLEKALDKSITLQIKNEPIILKNDTQPQDSITESEKNLIKTSNQQTENIFEQLGSILSSIGNSIFSFLS